MPTNEWNKEYWSRDLKNFQSRDHVIRNEIHYGDRWGIILENIELKKVVKNFIQPFVDERKTALEIGPGGGRWTDFLLNFKTLYLVDLNKNSFDYIQDRFPLQKFEFCTNSGNDFPNIPKKSIDYVFSHGVFVHIDLGDIIEYFSNLISILTENADIILQYSDRTYVEGKRNDGYSWNNRDIMNKVIRDFGFNIVDEFLGIHDDSNLVHFTNRNFNKTIQNLNKNTTSIIDFYYASILNREVDKEGSQLFMNKLESKQMTELEFKISLLRSDEYKILINNLVEKLVSPEFRY